jgi:hypothetical protein
MYKIMYVDAEGDLPKIGYPTVAIDLNLNSIFDAGEVFEMTEEDAGDTDVTDGKIFYYNTTLTEESDLYTYTFNAMDTGDVLALGIAGQIFDGPDVFINKAPELKFTGATGFVNDGVEPNEDYEGTTFNFEISFSDFEGDLVRDNKVELWIDMNMDGDFDDTGDMKKAMTEADAADVNTIDGKVYKASQVLNEPGLYGYRFHAFDTSGNIAMGVGAAAYIQGPNVLEIIPNRLPTLAFTGEVNFEFDGVNPPDGKKGTTFTFKVKYIDLDNDAPKAGFPKLSIDGNEDGDFADAEDFVEQMIPVNAADTDFTDGKIYQAQVTLDKAGTYSYKFDVENDMNQTTVLGVIEGPVVWAPKGDEVEPGEAMLDTWLWIVIVIVLAIVFLILGFGIGKSRKKEPEYQPRYEDRRPLVDEEPEDVAPEEEPPMPRDELPPEEAPPEEMPPEEAPPEEAPPEEPGADAGPPPSEHHDLESKTEDAEAPADEIGESAPDEKDASVDSEIDSILDKLEEDDK